ncbi:MAG: hypothetical protein JWQ98_2385 [Chlorobi bacterium]|nr:hypothetical protein [Chlorobiota bacterium]
MKLVPLIHIALIVLSAQAFAGPKHDVHISYCKSQLTRTSLSGKVSYYKDDFVKALRNRQGTAFYGQGPARLEQAITAYMRQNFTATTGAGEKLPLIITSTGIDETSIWFNFTFSSSAPISSISIGNTVLFQEFRDQMNMINVKTPTGEHSLVLTSSDPNGSIQL